MRWCLEHSWVKSWSRLNPPAMEDRQSWPGKLAQCERRMCRMWDLVSLALGTWLLRVQREMLDGRQVANKNKPFTYY